MSDNTNADDDGTEETTEYDGVPRGCGCGCGYGGEE